MPSRVSRTKNQNRRWKKKEATVRRIEGKMVDPTSDEGMANKRGYETAPPPGRKTRFTVTFDQFQPNNLFPNDQRTTVVQPVGDMTAALTVGSPSGSLGSDGEDDIANSTRPFAAPLGSPPAHDSDREDAINDSADSEGTTATSERMSSSKRSSSASDDQPEEPAKKRSRVSLNTSPTIITGSEAGTSSTTSTSSNESFFSSHEGNNTFEHLQHRTLTFQAQQLLQRQYEGLLQVTQQMEKGEAALTRKDNEHVAALGLKDEELKAALDLKDEEHKAALMRKDGDNAAALTDHAAALTRKDEEHKAALGLMDEEHKVALMRKDGDHAASLIGHAAELTFKDEVHKVALASKDGDHAAALKRKDDEHAADVLELKMLLEEQKQACEANAQSSKTVLDLCIRSFGILARVDQRATQG
jgi:hypothetical protein